MRGLIRMRLFPFYVMYSISHEFGGARVKRFLALALLSFAGHAFAADGDFDPTFGIGGVASLEYPVPPTFTVYTRALRVLAVPGGKSVILVSHAASPTYTPIASARRLLRRRLARPDVRRLGHVRVGQRGRAVPGHGHEGHGRRQDRFRPRLERQAGGAAPPGGRNARPAVRVVGRGGRGPGRRGEAAPARPAARRQAPRAHHALCGLQRTAESALLRLDGTGALDPTFGTGGIAFTGIAGRTTSPGARVAGRWRDRRRLLAAERARAAERGPSQGAGALFHYGALDTTFGTAGEATIPLLAYAIRLDAGLAVLPTGACCVAGYSHVREGAGCRARAPDRRARRGVLAGGVALAPPGEVPDIPAEIAVLADGRFVTRASARYGAASSVRQSEPRALPARRCASIPTSAARAVLRGHATDGVRRCGDPARRQGAGSGLARDGLQPGCAGGAAGGAGGERGGGRVERQGRLWARASTLTAVVFGASPPDGTVDLHGCMAAAFPPART